MLRCDADSTCRRFVISQCAHGFLCAEHYDQLHPDEE